MLGLVVALLAAGACARGADVVQGFNYTNFTAAALDRAVTLASIDPDGTSLLFVAVPPTAEVFSVWNAVPVPVYGMRTNFTVVITPSNAGIEGFVFHIQNDPYGDLAGGGVGARLNYDDTVRNDFAIEFDCLRSADFDDALPEFTTYHYAVHSLGNETNSAYEARASKTEWQSQSGIGDFCDGQPNNFTLFETGVATPILFSFYDMGNMNPNVNKSAYIGFTGAANANGGSIEIVSWSYEYRAVRFGHCRPLVGVPNATLSTVTALASNLVAGDSTQVTLVVFDQYNITVPYGGLDVTATAIATGNAPPATATVLDLHNGTFIVTVTTTVADEYTLSIFLAGVLVPTSVQTVTYVPGPASGRNCIVVGGMPPSTMTAGGSASLVVQAYDQYDNPLVESGGANLVTATLTPTAVGNSIDTEDEEDGEYTVSYTMQTSGTYSLRVLAAGVLLPGFPFTITVNPGPATASRSVATCPTSYVAGRVYSCSIEAKDAYNNRVQTTNDRFDSTLDPQLAGSSAVTSNTAPGMYTTRLQTNLTNAPAGYELTITLNFVDISGMPVDVLTQPAEPSYGLSTATGYSSTVAGERGSFIVQAIDVYGNEYRTSPSSFSLAPSIVGAGLLIVPVATNLNNGQYRYDYTLNTVGAYTIYVTSATAPVTNLTGSPGAVTVTIAPESAADSYILAGGDDYLKGEALRRTTFQIQTVDAFGNEYTTGGAAVVVTLVPATGTSSWWQMATRSEAELLSTPITPLVEDLRNGTYTVTYLPSETQYGTYTMTITIGGAAMFGGPVHVEIAPVDTTNVVLWAVLGSIAGVALLALAILLIVRRQAKRREYERIEEMRGTAGNTRAAEPAAKPAAYTFLPE